MWVVYFWKITEILTMPFLVIGESHKMSTMEKCWTIYGWDLHFLFCDVYFIGGSSQRENKDILIF